MINSYLFLCFHTSQCGQQGKHRVRRGALIFRGSFHCWWSPTFHLYREKRAPGKLKMWSQKQFDAIARASISFRLVLLGILTKQVCCYPLPDSDTSNNFEYVLRIVHGIRWHAYNVSNHRNRHLWMMIQYSELMYQTICRRNKVLIPMSVKILASPDQLSCRWLDSVSYTIKKNICSPYSVLSWNWSHSFCTSRDLKD